MTEQLKHLRHRIGCWSRWPRFPRQRLAKNSWSKDYPCQLRYAYSGIPQACLGMTRISLDWLSSARDPNETFRCNQYRNQSHNRNNSEPSHALRERNDGGMWKAWHDFRILVFCLAAATKAKTGIWESLSYLGLHVVFDHHADAGWLSAWAMWTNPHHLEVPWQCSRKR